MQDLKSEGKTMFCSMTNLVEYQGWWWADRLLHSHDWELRERERANTRGAVPAEVTGDGVL